MDWIQVVSIILGSSLLTKLVDILYSTYIARSDKDKERQEQLYSQLYFYLMLVEICNATKEELLEDRSKAFSEQNFLEDTEAKEKWLRENFNNQKEFVLKLEADIFNYVELIKNLLVANSKHIRKEDWGIVERFFKEYFIKDIVAGKGSGEGADQLFSILKIQETFSSLPDILDEMMIKMKF